MTPARLLLILAVTCCGLLLALPAAAQTVSIAAGSADPSTVEVEIGQTLTFTNHTDGEIRIVDDAGRWDSGTLAPGEVFSISFDSAGTITYSSADGTLSGEIVVVEPGAAGDEPDDGAAGGPTEEPAAGETPADEPPTEEPPTEGPPADAAGDDAGPAGLADTGAPVALLAGAAAGLLLVGTLLLRRA